MRKASFKEDLAHELRTFLQSGELVSTVASGFADLIREDHAVERYIAPTVVGTTFYSESLLIGQLVSAWQQGDDAAGELVKDYLKNSKDNCLLFHLFESENSHEELRNFTRELIAAKFADDYNMVPEILHVMMRSSKSKTIEDCLDIIDEVLCVDAQDLEYSNVMLTTLVISDKEPVAALAARRLLGQKVSEPLIRRNIVRLLDQSKPVKVDPLKPSIAARVLAYQLGIKSDSNSSLRSVLNSVVDIVCDTGLRYFPKRLDVFLFHMAESFSDLDFVASAFEKLSHSTPKHHDRETRDFFAGVYEAIKDKLLLKLPQSRDHDQVTSGSRLLASVLGFRSTKLSLNRIKDSLAARILASNTAVSKVHQAIDDLMSMIRANHYDEHSQAIVKRMKEISQDDSRSIRRPYARVFVDSYLNWNDEVFDSPANFLQHIMELL